MKKATIGNLISFKRDNKQVKGTVVKVNENSVMVEVSDFDMIRIKLPNNLTIVNHKHYSLLP